MTRCFVPGCKSYKSTARYRKNVRHFFKVPRDAGRLQLWERAIPGVKLSTSGSLCDLHFADEDILKVFKYNIRGDIVAVPRVKWALKADAVPRLFPNFPSDLSEPTGKRSAPASLAKRQEKQEKASTEIPQNVQKASSKGCQTSLPVTCTQETQTQEVCSKSSTELPEAPVDCRTRDCGTATDLTFYCEECGGTFVTALRLYSHKRASHQKKWLKCECPDGSHSPNNRSCHAVHEQMQHRMKDAFCKLCCRRFMSNEDFETHNRVVHTEEKSFKCDECGRRFKFFYCLKRHEKSHSKDATKHACPACQKMFRDKHELECHLRRHTGERPFQCKHCSQSFARLSSVRKHEHSKHVS
uniref:Putative zinc finger protein n=1 Tax=Rhipicephalus pulchellus TaxID=72859 RepID=L7LUP2_RHIPC